MDIELLKYFLPEGLMKYFSITKVEEVEEISRNRKVLQIELQENFEIQFNSGISQNELKDLFVEMVIQDFPIQGKAVNLAFKQRKRILATTQK
ncbi:MAG: hypothetical protein WCR42_11800 [bacterium]